MKVRVENASTLNEDTGVNRSASPEDLTQIRLALEQTTRIRFYRNLFLVSWSLILAKCLFLEWLTQRYALPVDTFLFIWIPSFLFAGLCTALLVANRKEALLHAPLTSRLVQAIWLGVIGAIAIIGIAGVGLHQIPPFLLPGLCAVLMGIGYLVHSVLDHRFILRAAAAGWWMGSLWLFYRPGPDSLLHLTLLLLFFQVGPTSGMLYQEWKMMQKIRHLERKSTARASV